MKGYSKNAVFKEQNKYKLVGIFRPYFTMGYLCQYKNPYIPVFYFKPYSATFAGTGTMIYQLN
jgi:hypothetical protein